MASTIKNHRDLSWNYKTLVVHVVDAVAVDNDKYAAAGKLVKHGPTSRQPDAD